MLKTVENSAATKTRGIAVTYRAGNKEMYGTCPASCELNCSGKGSQKIDHDYFDALLAAVPRGGISFTYTHFDWFNWCDKANKETTGQTVVNYSASTLSSAVVASRVVPTVVVVGEDLWANGKVFSTDAVPVVRCPAEYREKFSCADCGNGIPLCARRNRDYIIGFTAHGSGKKKAADPETVGGCYADGGRVRLHWNATANSDQITETDGEKLKRFAEGLRAGSIIRHHVAGDIG